MRWIDSSGKLICFVCSAFDSPNRTGLTLHIYMCRVVQDTPYALELLEMLCMANFYDC